MCKRTQHVTSNNIWELLVNNVGSVCTELKIVVRVELRVNVTFALPFVPCTNCACNGRFPKTMSFAGMYLFWDFLLQQHSGIQVSCKELALEPVNTMSVQIFVLLRRGCMDAWLLRWKMDRWVDRKTTETNYTAGRKIGCCRVNTAKTCCFLDFRFALADLTSLKTLEYGYSVWRGGRH